MTISSEFPATNATAVNFRTVDVRGRNLTLAGLRAAVPRAQGHTVADAEEKPVLPKGAKAPLVLTFDKKATPYTTKTGIKGSIGWAESTNTPQKGKCASDGKAVTFGFKNSKGDYVSWNWYGAKGVKDEVPKETIMKILSTVRLYGEPTG